MCGIAGFVGEFSADALALASMAIAHRGPDADGTWMGPTGKVGLAHRRLSIIDLSSTGAQPMISEDGAIALVFNGEIYNFRDLREQLRAKGHRFRGTSDTEVLLRLYEAHGEDMLAMLNGIFSFAIWDGRGDKLFVARDALGVKPLYYGTSPRGFAFASEIKALLQLLPDARELDAVALHRYLCFLYCPGDGTPLKAVRKVAPGEAMIFRDGAIRRKWTWYTLPTLGGGARHPEEAPIIQSTAAILRSAVHRQMVSDVPVGAFLSGGLDSSAVVSFAREIAPDIRCFTIEVEGGQEPGVVDDLPYARKVAQHLGVSLEVVHVDAADMAKDLEGMVAQLDEPLGDPAALNVLYISGLARKSGMKVLLSGAGGDDLFGGYRRHVAVRIDEMTAWVPAGLLAALEKGAMAVDQRNPTLRRVTRFLRDARLEGDERLTSYFAWARESDLLDLYSPQFRAAVGRSKWDEPMLAFLKTRRESTPLDRMLTLEQRFFLADHNLVYTDKMSMAKGVEVRVPFLDLDLVEHAARIPDQMKQRGRIGKWILKKSMEPYLPREVIYRPKSGFGAPLRRWLRHELRPLLEDVLSRRSLESRGLFDPAAVRRVIDMNHSGRTDAAYILLSLMSIEIWCRAYIDVAHSDLVTQDDAYHAPRTAA